MLFKSDTVGAEFFVAHPRLRAALWDVDRKVSAERLPDMTLTDVLRTPEFYGPNSKRWSWHYVGCAADIRTHRWSAEQKALVYGWLLDRCPKADGWDVIHENEGQPTEHFHVEFEDADLKAAWLAKREAGTV